MRFSALDLKGPTIDSDYALAISCGFDKPLFLSCGSSARPKGDNNGWISYTNLVRSTSRRLMGSVFKGWPDMAPDPCRS